MYTLVYTKNFGFKATKERVRRFHSMSELGAFVEDKLTPESNVRAFSPANIFIPEWA